MSEFSTIEFLLMSVLDVYPQIATRYPPGALAIRINNAMPEPSAMLFDDDVIALAVAVKYPFSNSRE